MPTFANTADVPTYRVDTAEGTLSSQRVYGTSSSMTIAELPPCFRSPAAVSPAEEILALMNGDLWLFVTLSQEKREALHLHPGDYARVPSMAICASWNPSRLPCKVISCHGPGLRDDPICSGVATALLAPDEVGPDRVKSQPSFVVDATRYGMDDLQKCAEEWPAGSELLRRGADVPEYVIDRGFAAPLSTKMAYGERGSVMYATRPAGYKSTPHVHDCEQLNHVVEGELCGLVVDPHGATVTYRLHAGDFWRIPPLAVHWAWNQTDRPVTLFEYHIPGLECDPVVGRLAASLGVDSARTRDHGPVNVFLDATRYAAPTLLDAE